MSINYLLSVILGWAEREVEVGMTEREFLTLRSLHFARGDKTYEEISLMQNNYDVSKDRQNHKDMIFQKQATGMQQQAKQNPYL